jgi:hypothetical protein
MAEAFAPTAKPARSLGAWSIWLWAIALAAFVLVTSVFVMTPKTVPDVLQHIWIGVMLVVVLLISPALHICGLVLGLTALFRPAERRGLAAVGAALNGATIIGACLLLWAAIGTMGHFR